MKKKLKAYLVGLLCIILLEILVFNFSSVCSLGYQKINLMDKASMNYTDEGVECSIIDINVEIKNLYFDLNLEKNSPVDYAITLTDEGNYYDYYLPKGTIAYSSKPSFYTNIHSYGKVKTITITFSPSESSYVAPFSINGVYANVKRPVFFNVVRVILVYLLFVFLYSLKNNSSILNYICNSNLTTKEGKIQLIVTIICMLTFIMVGLYLSNSHILFNEASKPHHQQYKELAYALEKGQVYLDYSVTEGVLNAPNPYDTIYLQANGIEYKTDYAYYEGRYYVYFGIIPELLLYYPCRLLFHKDFPNHYAVFVFFILFVVGTFMFLREMIKRYFAKMPMYIYLLVSASLIGAGTFAYIYFTADIYSVPIMAGLGLTTLGLYLWMKMDNNIAEHRNNPSADHRKKDIDICLLGFFGSLMMAMVAGCRPQMLIFSFLAFPIFWDNLVKEREYFSKKSVIRTLLLIVPYILIAALVMSYNYQRFGSVFDFGATYSLTNNDMNLRGNSLSRMLLSLGSFLFQLPYINSVFPYLHTVELDYDYMGRMVIEHYFGGIIACNLFTWSLLLTGYYRKAIKNKKLTAMFWIMLLSSIIIGLLDANAAGVLQRYSADMALGIFLASAVMIFVLVENAPVIGDKFVKLSFVSSMVYAAMIICNVDSGITLKYYNPELFYRIASLFKF